MEPCASAGALDRVAPSSAPLTARRGRLPGRFGPYFCEPVIAGLTDEGKPFITGMDLIGAMCAGARRPPCRLRAVGAALAPCRGDRRSLGTDWCLRFLPARRETPAEDFMVSGNNTESLLGVCESMWRPDLVRPRGGAAPFRACSNPSPSPCVVCLTLNECRPAAAGAGGALRGDLAVPPRGVQQGLPERLGRHRPRHVRLLRLSGSR